MKKLSLKNLKLGVEDLLQRDQLKAVFGGYNGGCAYQGGNGYYGVVSSSMSAGEAQWGSSVTGGNWCCSSCCSASWLTQDMIQELNC